MDAKKAQRKRLKREKIRKEHLLLAKKQRIFALRKELDDMFKIDYDISKEYIPPRDDQVNWDRINQFRAPINVLNQARKIFGKHPILEALYENKVKETDKESRLELGYIFTAAAQVLCSEPPFFIPYFKFFDLSPTMNFFWARNIARKDLWRIVHMDKKVTLNNKTYPVYLSEHFLRRFWERTTITDNLILRSHMYYMFYNDFEFQDGGNNMLGVVNTHERMKSLLGLHQPYGYSPMVKVEDDYIIAKTFLLPGYKNTPENEWFSVKVKADTIADIHKYKEQFSQNGVTSFLNEINNEVDLDRKFLEPIDLIWEKCKELYNSRWYT